MSKILVLGFALPSGDEDEIVQAVHIRPLQFTEALAKDGNEINFAAKPEPHFLQRNKPEHVHTYTEIDFTRPGWLPKLKKLIYVIRPDCCVSANFFISYAASFLKWDIPLWLDIFGDPIAEKQAALHREKTEKGLFSLPSMERKVLEAGDKFSVCSEAHKYALIGRLGHSGRLNQHTFGYPFVHSIPPSIVTIPESKEARKTPLVKSKQIPEDSFIALWTAGYNVWTDVQTLFKGLVKAMDSDSSLVFVSTGGPVISDLPYKQFRQLIDRSKHRERFFFLGWVSRSDLVQLYKESDCGISIDADCYETELGTRNRFLEMLSMGLPVVTSHGPEIASVIAGEEFGLTFPIGDSKKLSDCILKMSEMKKQNKIIKGQALAEKAKVYFNSYDTCKPLVEWCRSPSTAPDRNKIPGTLRWRGSMRGRLRDLKTRYKGLAYKDPQY